MDNNQTNSQRFLNLINQLEQFLHNLNKNADYIGTKRLIEKLSKTNGLLNLYKIDLIEFLELRNAIVHKSTGRPIAEPHEEIVNNLEKILNAISHPPLALTIATEPVYTCNTNSQLLEVIHQMSKNYYTSIPIYHDGVFVGVLSENAIFRWLAAQSGSLNLTQIKVSHLQDYFNHEQDKFHGFSFVTKQTDAYSVRSQFVKFIEDEKRLGAIFITENGQSDEKILGIITPWDLPKIRK